jgi:hypothetical protein
MRDKPLPRVFISYRRDDTAGHAGRLYDSLSSRPDVAEVFMDVGDIEPGVDFEAAIGDAVQLADLVIVMIGTRWLTAESPDGLRRLHEPHDYVATEIATALERNVRVIPVLVDSASMPAAVDLPPRLRGLAKRNALELSTTSWQRDVDALVDAIQGVRGGVGGDRHEVRNGSTAQVASPRIPVEEKAKSKPSLTNGRRSSRTGVWIGLAAIAAVLLFVVFSNLWDGSGGDTGPTPTSERPGPDPELEILVPDIYDLPEGDAYASLNNAGLAGESILVCSGSVSEGRVRQAFILSDNGNELIVSDEPGAPIDARGAKADQTVFMKISTGEQCG